MDLLIQVQAMQKVFICALLTASLAGLRGSTLQQLSLDDMIQKSTVIVRGKAQPSGTGFRGSVIYSHYQVQVSETLKGTAASQWDVAVPGGVSAGLRQSFAGAPALIPGQEYILFLWTSKTGLTQVIGLSQGLFSVSATASGQPVVIRAASTERMVNASGQLVSDSDIQMSLPDLRARVQNVLRGVR
jgi:hypothetical protein